MGFATPHAPVEHIHAPGAAIVIHGDDHGVFGEVQLLQFCPEQAQVMVHIADHAYEQGLLLVVIRVEVRPFLRDDQRGVRGIGGEAEKKSSS